MALPASLSTVTVTGTYVSLVGNPISGSISFTPEIMLLERTANVIIVAKSIVKTLDANGSFSVILPVTSDTDVVPISFSYTVTENFAGGREFKIALPLSVAGTTQNLADLLPSVTVAESSLYVTTDQYQALLTRYNTANGIYTTALTASTLATTAATYATDAGTAVTTLDDFTNSQLLLMGV